MPLATHGEIPYSVEDCKVYPYSGGVPGTAKDVPGIMSIEMDMNVEEAEHRGDNKVLATAAAPSFVELTITVGQLNLDAQAALAGGLVTTAGTTPTQIRTLTRKTTDVLADYQIKAQTQSKSADGGARRVVFPRCQWVGGPSYSMADNEFPEMEITARAVPNAANELFLFEDLETNAALT